MLERLLFVLLVFVIGMLLYTWMTRRQLAQVAVTAPRDPLLHGVTPGIPTLVYFTTPTCGPCRMQQTPTMQKLQTELGNRLQIVRVDATLDPDAANRWGVFSVPTTFVLRSDGTPRSVYNGVVSAQVLKRELQLET